MSTPSQGVGAAAGVAWDPLVRTAHWGIAAAVLLNGLLVEDESLAHVWIGYAAFGLLGLRLLWGFTGPTEARFATFPPSLAAAMRHVGEIRAGQVVPHRSHNPLGALMAYALWGTLLVVSVTGVMLETEPFPVAQAMVSAARADGSDHDDDHRTGDEHDSGGDASDEAVEEVHEAAANLLLLLAALHVAGVAFETRRTGRDIVGPMLRGRAGPSR